MCTWVPKTSFSLLLASPVGLLCACSAAAKLRGEYSILSRRGQRIGPERVGLEAVPSRGHLSADRAGTPVGAAVDAAVGAAVVTAAAACTYSYVRTYVHTYVR